MAAAARLGSVVAAPVQEMSPEAAKSTSASSAAAVDLPTQLQQQATVMPAQQAAGLQVPTEQAAVTTTGERLVNGASDAAAMAGRLLSTERAVEPPTVAASPPLTRSCSDAAASTVDDEPASSLAGADVVEPATTPAVGRLVDPIALLNEMLSQSRPSSAAVTNASTVSFLHSLTMLTTTSQDDNDDDAVYMGSYDDDTRSAADTTSAPVHDTSRPAATTAAVSIPISLASASMGPPPLESLYATSGIPGVTGGLSSGAAAVTTNAASRDGDLVSRTLSSIPPATAQLSADFVAAVPSPAYDDGVFPLHAVDVKPVRECVSAPSASHETSYPLPGIDVKMTRDLEHHDGPLPENSFAAAFQFTPVGTAGVSRDVAPVDEFTERLRRKTSIPLSDRGTVQGPSVDRMLDESLGPPPFEPPTINFPAPKPVYHDQQEAEPEYHQYGGEFDRKEIGEHSPGELHPMLPGPPVDPVQFPPAPPHGPSPHGYPRPDFFLEPRRRLPVDSFRPRFMSRLPPPSAFSNLRSPPPFPERFQRPFFPRF